MRTALRVGLEALANCDDREFRRAVVADLEDFYVEP
jgi:hypothetical protein